MNNSYIIHTFTKSNSYQPTNLLRQIIHQYGSMRRCTPLNVLFHRQSRQKVTNR